MPREDKVEMGGFVDGVEHGKNSTARVSNCILVVGRIGYGTDMLDIMSQHHFMEYLSTGQSDESSVSIAKTG
jgi:hypothetical protein